jgi:hypothetical protein
MSMACPITSHALAHPYAGGGFAKKYVSPDIRHILLAGMAGYSCSLTRYLTNIASESAVNDGLAYPFLSLSLYLALESDLRTALKNWLIVGCFCKFIIPESGSF